MAALRQIAECGVKFNVYAAFQNDVDGEIAALLDHPCVHPIQGDLTLPEFRDTLPQADFVIHMAGYGQPQRFMRNPYKTIRLNSEATLDLLDQLPSGARMLFVSSSEVYAGLPKGTVFRETQIGTSGPDHPRACYIEGKRCGEAACFAAHSSGVNAISARLALAYGPGARSGDMRAMYSFIDRAIRDHQITLLDQGDAVRSYCYAADAVNMMLRILIEGSQPVYNVAGNHKLSFLDVAKKIGQLMNVPVRISEHSKTLVGAPIDVSLDMSRYQDEFGPPIYTDFDEGIRRTVNWHILRTEMPGLCPVKA
jgi:nucleoside-diphosphate-sugar epimerase